jgi:hypothetical protein
MLGAYVVDSPREGERASVSVPNVRVDHGAIRSGPLTFFVAVGVKVN